MRNEGSLPTKWRVITAAAVASFGSAAMAAPGDPLGPAIPVVPTQALGPGSVSLGSDAAGNMVVVWHELGDLKARRYAADGTALGSDIVVADVGDDADVAVEKDGDFVIAWKGDEAGVPAVLAQRYHADGTPNGARLQVSEAAGGDGDTVMQAPSVAVDDDGDFVVVWGQGREVQRGNQLHCAYGVGMCSFVGNYSVRARRYTDGGTKARPVQTVDSTKASEISVRRIVLHSGSDQGRISVAMAPNGAFVVAWNHIRHGVALLSGVYARRYSAAGIGELKRIVSLQGDEGMPAVAMDDYGGYVVAYRRVTRKDDGIYLRSFPAGPGLGRAEVRVDTATSDAYRDAYPAVAIGPAGNYVVSWSGAADAYGEHRYVRAQRYASGGGALGGNFDVVVTPPTGNNLNACDVAMDDNGNFAIVSRLRWIEYPTMFGESKGRIDLQRYVGP